MGRTIGMVASLLVAGCLTQGRLNKPSVPPRPITEFPSAASLATVEAKSAVLPSLDIAEVPAEGWTVEGTEAERAAPAEAWTPHGPWEEALAGAYSAAGQRATPTKAMACVAGEVGRFYLMHRAAPPEPVRRFIGAACGEFSPTVGFRWLSGTAPAGMTDDKVLERWRTQLRPELIDQLPAGAKRVGFWFGRRAGVVVVVAVHEASPVELKPFSPIPDANGDLTIEGRLDGPANGFAGYVNQGRFGVSSCLVDPSVQRPSFRITCRVAPDDATAWLQIVYSPPRSVLAVPIAQVLARRDTGKPPVFSETPYSSSRPIADAAAFAPAALAGINAVRAEAGLGPVRLSDAQSAVAARVARQYFAAAMAKGGVDTTGDLNTIALGLMAGWQVAGTIREGSFFSAVVPRTRDAGRWLDTVLALPIGRQTLLARDTEEVALGPALFDKPDAVGGIVCGYRFHHGNDHTADVELLLRRIAVARQRMGLSAPARIAGVADVLGQHLARVQQGTAAPIDALRYSLEDVTERQGASTRGVVFEATSLDALEIPPEILRMPSLRLDIGVTHYKPPGAAWAQLVVVIVYVASSSIEI